MKKSNVRYNSNGYNQMYAATAIVLVLAAALIMGMAVVFNAVSPNDTSIDRTPVTENSLPDAVEDVSFFTVSEAFINDDYMNYVGKTYDNVYLNSGSLVLFTPSSTNEIDFERSDVINIYRGTSGVKYKFVDADQYCTRKAVDALDVMTEEFYAATHKNSLIVGGYASVEDMRNSGKLSQRADLASGCSIMFYLLNGDKLGEDEYLWLVDNSYKYGFILRYTDAKSKITGVGGYAAIYRYVGLAHSMFMHNNDMCLEEYLEHVKKYDYKNPVVITYDNTVYKVYYTPASASGSTKIMVPLNYPYEISGNNTDGFIVTVTEKKADADTSGDASDGSEN